MRQQKNFFSLQGNLWYLLMVYILFLFLSSCYDLNIFRVAQDINKRIDEADSTQFYFLLDDRDVSRYLRYNGKKRNELIEYYTKEGEESEGEHRVLHYLNVIKLLFRTTEIADISFVFFIDLYQTLLDTGEDFDLNEYADAIYENIKGKGKQYVSDFVSYSILLQNMLNLLGAEFKKGEEFPSSNSGFEETKFAFAEVAIMSSIFDFLYRFHRVIEVSDTGTITKKDPVCKVGETETACEIADTDPVEYKDDYKETLIKYLSNEKEYKDIFILKVEDFVHIDSSLTVVPTLKVKDYIFNKGFLYDNNLVGSKSNIEDVVKECGLEFLLEEIEDI